MPNENSTTMTYLVTSAEIPKGKIQGQQTTISKGRMTLTS